MLTIENLTYRIGGRMLLERASLALTGRRTMPGWSAATVPASPRS